MAPVWDDTQPTYISSYFSSKAHPVFDFRMKESSHTASQNKMERDPNKDWGKEEESGIRGIMHPSLGRREYLFVNKKNGKLNDKCVNTCFPSV